MTLFPDERVKIERVQCPLLPGSGIWDSGSDYRDPVELRSPTDPLAR